VFLINDDRDIINANWTFLVDFSVFWFYFMLMKLFFIVIINQK